MPSTSYDKNVINSLIDSFPDTSGPAEVSRYICITGARMHSAEVREREREGEREAALFHSCKWKLFAVFKSPF